MTIEICQYDNISMSAIKSVPVKSVPSANKIQILQHFLHLHYICSALIDYMHIRHTSKQLLLANVLSYQLITIFTTKQWPRLL